MFLFSLPDPVVVRLTLVYFRSWFEDLCLQLESQCGCPPLGSHQEAIEIRERYPNEYDWQYALEMNPKEVGFVCSIAVGVVGGSERMVVHGQLGELTLVESISLSGVWVSSLVEEHLRIMLNEINRNVCDLKVNNNIMN